MTEIYNPNQTTSKENTMNDLQTKCFHYLTTEEGSTYMRLLSLRRLIEEGAFTPDQDEEETERIIRDFVRDNVIGACDAGIDRFMETLGLVKPVTTQSMQIVLNIVFKDVESGPMSYGQVHAVPASIAYNHEGRGHSMDCGLVPAVLSAIRSEDWCDSVTWADYGMNVTDSDGDFPNVRLDR